jgi:hypothetical protein
MTVAEIKEPEKDADRWEWWEIRQATCGQTSPPA